ncbi:hypothetical protein AWE51_14480 [Aquimarina aggregata]|uniref:Nuclear transport factor 2 family protein n=1 Tax=Aquimarina aggregata TaxID=1642818 RepID=A0A162XV67_9FLAO|nr:hypothetical protein [Aquimarina aggregata]KZS38789.1 hypothetical protein AWE51_14480 [Aquimarina aggregata]
MKNILCILLYFTISISLHAQETKKYLKKVSSLDTTLETLYDVISGEKGEQRNWELFKFLFAPEAKLIPSGKSKEDIFKVRYLSPDEYINTSGKWLLENGFFEKEIHRTVNTFGNITHVFSTYESFKSKTDKKPFMRGINSIQLLNDGKRWWVVNIYWTQETKENPIPKEYLLTQ